MRRRSTVAIIKTIPNVAWNEGVIVKSNSLWIITINLHTLWHPTIRSSSIEIDIADLICTWSIYLKRIWRTLFKCPSGWIIQPWCIYLVIRGNNHKDPQSISFSTYQFHVCHKASQAPNCEDSFTRLFLLKYQLNIHGECFISSRWKNLLEFYERHKVCPVLNDKIVWMGNPVHKAPRFARVGEGSFVHNLPYFLQRGCFHNSNCDLLVTKEQPYCSTKARPHNVL